MSSESEFSKELRIYESLLEGYIDYIAGRVEDAETVEDHWRDKFKSTADK